MIERAATAGGLVFLHLLAIAAVPYIFVWGLSATEVTLHLVFYFIGGIGITALYHRSWTHNAVTFDRRLEYFLAAAATLVIQLPARQWIETHMDHHKHTDHEHDPYNIQKGFWWAHFTWMLNKTERVSALPRRLMENPVVEWQEKYYWPLSITLNLIVPFLVGLLVGAPWWGFVLLSALRVAIMGNVVFAVNSICHYWGRRPYCRKVSARDVWWFPLALGEQYHNFHHKFPRDYRHGIGVADLDATKWFINLMFLVGLADRLFVTPQKAIDSARQEVLSSK